jgi:hypothetical protein
LVEPELIDIPLNADDMTLTLKSTTLVAIIISIVSVLTHGQTRRTFDNFDRTQGVQIVTPTVVSTVKVEETKTKGKSKKLVKKTSQTMSVADGYGVRESSVYSKIVMTSGNSLVGFTTGDQKIDSYIVESSKRYNIDPLLIYSQMHQESSFKLRATSNKGASGLMQLMPATARRFGVTSIYDPKQNIDAGVKYMRWLLDTFKGDVILALAGYNAGEGAVMKYGWNVPPYRETQEYVRRISARYNAIGNPTNLAKTLRQVSKDEVAQIDSKQATPLSIYEPDILTVRMPDGSKRLVRK